MEAQQTSPYAALKKTAAGKGGWGAGWLYPTPGQAQNAGLDANEGIWRLILLSAGLGAAGRAGLGLAHLMQPAPSYNPTPSYQRVGIATADEDEKQAADDPFSQGVDWLAGLTEKAFPWGKTPFFGRGASSAGAVPAYLGIGIPAASLAMMGSWGLTDKVLDWRRKQELNNRLQAARSEYQRLLNEALVKHSADEDGIEAELDELADIVTAGEEKTAFTLTDAPGYAGGALTAYALLSLLGSGLASYNFFRSRNQRTIAEEALKRRAKERAGGVAPLYLEPSKKVV